MTIQITGYSVWEEVSMYCNELDHLQDFETLEQALEYVDSNHSKLGFVIQVNFDKTIEGL